MLSFCGKVFLTFFLYIISKTTKKEVLAFYKIQLLQKFDRNPTHITRVIMKTVQMPFFAHFLRYITALNHGYKYCNQNTCLFFSYLCSIIIIEIKDVTTETVTNYWILIENLIGQDSSQRYIISMTITWKRCTNQ